MKIVLVLAVCLVSAFAAPPSDGLTKAQTWLEINANLKDTRIISGAPAAVGQRPWQIRLTGRSPAGTWLCGGSLISEVWVLTAAHCVSGALSFTIYLGGLTTADYETGRIAIEATNYIMHSGFNDNLNNDIAVIQLSQPVTLSNTIQPVKLAERGTFVEGGRVLTVSGFGKTSDAATTASPVLNYVDVNAITNAECAWIYGTGVIVDSTLCTVGNTNEGTCSGDSGGPLVYFDANGTPTLQGVVSFGASAGCELGYPSGFARVTEFLDWIAGATGLNV